MSPGRGGFGSESVVVTSRDWRLAANYLSSERTLAHASVVVLR
jgi:hypothetical protein